MTALHWRKPSHCNHNACVEVAGTADGVAVRDSKHPDGPVQRYSRDEFAAHILAAKRGDYDDLCQEATQPTGEQIAQAELDRGEGVEFASAEDAIAWLEAPDEPTQEREPR